ncbi:ABC transporter permease subunit [Microvirga sp. SYSU G3D207]|uniref:ABC transporter permease subunit n=1 Tax=Microvirga arsenatis TaxID=2692265 RepID=A0ABW9YS95_9HYPH|nr:ABC transporter permease subunit [Microvirga arsenatis]NBJ22925.1 ABC transporter permease subunit [Microvirga arsenatis]
MAAVGMLVLLPLASLIGIAAEGDAEIWPHLLANVLPSSIVDTLALLAGVAVVAGSMGITTAWLVTAHRFPGRGMLVWLLPLPLAVPTYITAYIYVEMFDSAGLVQMALREFMGWRSRADYWFPEIRSLPGCILVMSVVLYPYIYIAARAMFLTQSASMLEVARTLGASRIKLFRIIALPLARPALAVGVSLALLEALNDIGASEYLGVRTLTVSVYNTWLNRGSLAGAAQIACVMLAFVVGLILIERYGRRDRRYAPSPKRHRTVHPVPLVGGRAWLAAVLCAVPAVLGFILPTGFLLRETLRGSLFTQLDADFLAHFLTTIGLSLVATAATLVVAVMMVSAARLSKTPLTKGALFAAGLGYALPGTVLALGLMTPLVGFDNLIGMIWRTLTGERLGLLLMGAAGGIVIAYVIRFLSIATGSLSAGLDRVSPSLEDAARTLGASRREMVWTIQIPLMRPALASAALLIFVDCIKELPATLLLRPLNTETLSTLVYTYASRGRFEDGSLAALVIVLVGLIPVIQLVRSAEAHPKRAEAEASSGSSSP